MDALSYPQPSHSKRAGGKTRRCVVWYAECGTEKAYPSRVMRSAELRWRMWGVLFVGGRSVSEM
eukprot:516526-Rhodomonas_salina.1